MEYAEPEGDEQGAELKVSGRSGPPAPSRRRRGAGATSATTVRRHLETVLAQLPPAELVDSLCTLSCEHVCMHGVLGALAHMRRSGTHITLGLSALWRARSVT